MSWPIIRRSVFLALTPFVCVDAGAELLDRGNGLIYDTELDITWLQDANYPATTGISPDGRLTWDEAVAWAADLVYQGYDDWRLPTTLSPDPSCGFSSLPAAGTGCTGSEMGRLFNVDGISSDTPGPFINLQPYWYWSQTEHPDDPSTIAYDFPFHTGFQTGDLKSSPANVWAVRDGDVANSSNVTYEFEGIVESIEGEANLEGLGIVPGVSTFSGSFTFDPESPPGSSSSSNSQYHFEGFFNASIDDTYQIIAQPRDVDPPSYGIFVANDSTVNGGDLFSITGQLEGIITYELPDRGAPVLNLRLSDSTESVFGDTSLPQSLDLESFDSAIFRVGTNICCDQASQYRISGRVLNLRLTEDRITPGTGEFDLYTLSPSTTSGELLTTIDPQSGATTSIVGETGFDLTGLAYDVTTDSLYSVADDVGDQSGSLVRVNKSTAASELVGSGLGIPATIANDILDITADPTGDSIFGIMRDGGSGVYLISIDTTTGQASYIGDTGLQFGIGLAYQPNTSQLLALTDDPLDPQLQRRLYEVNPATAEVTALDDPSITRFMERIAANPNDGTLFAIGGALGNPCCSNGVQTNALYSIDPELASESETFIGFHDNTSGSLSIEVVPRDQSQEETVYELYAIDINASSLVVLPFYGDTPIEPRVIARLPVATRGLVYDDIRDVLYAANAATDSLLTIDPMTGSVSEDRPFLLESSGSPNVINSVDDLAIGGGGRILGITADQFSGTSLVDIDSASGAATYFGGVSSQARGSTGLAYQPRDGFFYAVPGNVFNNLYRLDPDPASMADVQVGGIPGSRSDSIAIHPVTGDAFVAQSLLEPVNPSLLRMRTDDAQVLEDYELPPGIGVSGLAFVPVAPAPNPETLVIDPSSLEFGGVEVGSTTLRSVTATNFEDRTVNVGATTLPPFSVLSGSPVTLLANESQDIEIEFAPDVVGAQQGFLVVSADVEGSPFEVSLTGSGTEPPVFIPVPFGLSPGELSSPGPILENIEPTLSWNAVVGATTYLVRIRNLETDELLVNADVTVTSVSELLDPTTPFRWDVAACIDDLCSDFSDPRYFVTPDDNSSQDEPIEVPTRIDDRNVVFVDLSDHSVSNATSYTYELFEASYPERLAVQATGDCSDCISYERDVEVFDFDSVTAPRVGEYWLRMSESDGNMNVYYARYEYNGQGFEVTGVVDPTPTTPELELAPAVVEFGAVEVGSVGETVITVNNVASRAIAFAASTLPPFSLVVAAEFDLGPGEGVDVLVSFQPPSEGVFDGSFVVDSDAFGSPFLVPLGGVGVAMSTADVSLVPSSIDFGTIVIGNQAPSEILSISNSGNAELIFSEISIFEEAADDYLVDGTDCLTRVLASGENCLVQVDFFPSERGSRSASLSLLSNTPQSPNLVPLNGIGYVPNTRRCTRLWERFGELGRRCEILAFLRSDAYFSVPTSLVTDQELLDYVSTNRRDLVLLINQVSFGRDVLAFMNREARGFPNEDAYLRAIRRNREALDYADFFLALSLVGLDDLVTRGVRTSIGAIAPVIDGIAVFRRFEIALREFPLRTLMEGYFDLRSTGYSSAETRFEIENSGIYDEYIDLIIALQRRMTEDLLFVWLESAYGAWLLVAPGGEALRQGIGLTIAQDATGS